MKLTKVFMVGVGALLLCTSVLWAKSSGNMLEKHLYAPRLAESKQVLALVKVTNVSYDRTPEKPWWKTGTLTLRTLETIGGALPSPLRVRFYLRNGRENEWTWDNVELGTGRRLLGFFNQWNGPWEVTRDGATGVIQNVERIRPATRAAIQKQFKTPLLPPKRSHHVGLSALPADKSTQGRIGLYQFAYEDESAGHPTVTQPSFIELQPEGQWIMYRVPSDTIAFVEKKPTTIEFSGPGRPSPVQSGRFQGEDFLITALADGLLVSPSLNPRYIKVPYLSFDQQNPDRTSLGFSSR